MYWKYDVKTNVVNQILMITLELALILLFLPHHHHQFVIFVTPYPHCGLQHNVPCDDVIKDLTIQIILLYYCIIYTKMENISWEVLKVHTKHLYTILQQN